MEGRDFSLDAPTGDGASTHLESTPFGGEPQDEALARGEEGALVALGVARALGTLDPRERHIIAARMMADAPLTLRDLGKQFQFSRERARQLELRGVRKLRRTLRPLARELGMAGRGPGDPSAP